MTSPDLFALPRSVLNPFLYADISLQDGAMTLTIASLFGRCGCDPWEEAARLARLPVRAAVASLAGMIAGAPTNLCPLPEATVLAARLVALRPGRRRPPASAWPRRRVGRSGAATCTLGLGVVVAVAAVWLFVADGGAPRAAEDGTGIASPARQQSAP